MTGQSNELDEQWGERLRKARLAAGLSQRGLGERIGLDGSVASARINRYELGVHRPDLLSVQNLARELDVPAAYFFADNDAMADLLYRYHHASKALRDEVKASLAAVPAMPKARPLKHSPGSRQV